MTVFKGHARELARHRFGSFALEKIAGHAGVSISRDIEGTSFEEEQQEERFESFEKLFADIVEVLLSSSDVNPRICHTPRCMNYL